MYCFEQCVCLKSVPIFVMPPILVDCVSFLLDMRGIIYIDAIALKDAYIEGVVNDVFHLNNPFTAAACIQPGYDSKHYANNKDLPFGEFYLS